MTALFKKATTTSSAPSFPAPISPTRAPADISVMLRSFLVKTPFWRGKSSTFFCSAGGSLFSGRTHGMGMEFCRMSLALADWICQGWAFGAMVSI